MPRQSRNRSLIYAIALFAIAWGIVDAGPIDKRSNSSVLSCTPTKWYNILLFFVTNYAIHAATVKSLPGESGWTSTAYKACCLLVPFAGVRRGLNIFMRASVLSKSPLHSAARANALCMVVRSQDWRPQAGEIVEGCEVAIAAPAEAEEAEETGQEFSEDVEKASQATSTTSPIKRVDVRWEIKAPYDPHTPSRRLGHIGDFLLYSYRFRPMPLEFQVVDRGDIEIHGVCRLPPGYTLCFVPTGMDVRPRGSSTEELGLSSQFSALQVLWSIAQTIIGSYTLWQAKGPQLNKYGYGSFGLTVIPYVIASVINLLAGLVSREYSAVFLVHSEVMDEAVARGGAVDGVVGTICPPTGYEMTAATEKEESGNVGDAAFEFSSEEDRDGSFICRRLNTEPIVPAAPEHPEVVLALTPPEKPMEEDTGKWRSYWHRKATLYKLLFSDPARDRAKARKLLEPSQYTIRVPSHGRFKRLPTASFENVFKILAIGLLILCVIAPYMIIFILTGYKRREATANQLNFTTQWLCLGQLYGFLVTEFERHPRKSNWGLILFLVFVLYSWAAVAGSVMVIEEMIEFGTCS